MLLSGQTTCPEGKVVAEEEVEPTWAVCLAVAKERHPKRPLPMAFAPRWICSHAGTMSFRRANEVGHWRRHSP